MTYTSLTVKSLLFAGCTLQQLHDQMDCFSCAQAEMRTASPWAMHTAWRGIEMAGGSGRQLQVCAPALHAGSHLWKLSMPFHPPLDLINCNDAARGSLAGVCQDRHSLTQM